MRDDVFRFGKIEGALVLGRNKVTVSTSIDEMLRHDYGRCDHWKYYLKGKIR